MSYKQFKPDTALSPYIDAYWQVTGDGTIPVTERIMPDFCIDIIINLGTNFISDGSGFVMKNESAYLVGTMTRFKDTVREPETHLVGIRFKPAAFGCFYKPGPLHELTDKITEFEKKLLPEINCLAGDFVGALNYLFLRRLSPSGPLIFQAIAEINNRMGKISVFELAKSQFTCPRQLERLFKLHTGVSPKEFISFVRYQFAVQNIRDRYATKSLLDIAFDSGYYDHAHMSNEIKKYTGISPSQL